MPLTQFIITFYSKNYNGTELEEWPWSGSKAIWETDNNMYNIKIPNLILK